MRYPDPVFSLLVLGTCGALTKSRQAVVQIAPMRGTADALELITTNIPFLEDAWRERKVRLVLWNGREVPVDVGEVPNVGTGALRISSAPVLAAMAELAGGLPDPADAVKKPKKPRRP